MSELAPEVQPLARGMLDKDIVKFGSFTLKSGKVSAAYVNLREMISFPDLFSRATYAYANTLRDSGLLRGAGGRRRYLSAVPEAATYYGGAVAQELGFPLVYHRVAAKEHGQPRAVEGRFRKGETEVVLLDDVITTAGSKIEEAKALGEAGLKVAGVVVLVDREQGGRTELASHGIDFAAVMTLSGIAKYALDEHLADVTQDLYDSLLGELDPTELGN